MRREFRVKKKNRRYGVVVPHSNPGLAPANLRQVSWLLSASVFLTSKWGTIIPTLQDWDVIGRGAGTLQVSFVNGT